MNKVVLMGRLTKDVELRYSQGVEPTAIARFNIAINRRYTTDNEPKADFINCVAFGKTAEFIIKYFSKGKMIAVAGEIRTNSWNDTKTGEKRYSTEVFCQEVNFCGDTKESTKTENSTNENTSENSTENSTNENISENSDFYSIETSIDNEDLPF